jgi:hypothetical protein
MVMSKSRAQELRMRIDTLRQDLNDGKTRLKALESELKMVCPHPDEYVKKMDEFRTPNPYSQRKALYLCKLCGVSKIKGVK